MSPDLPTQPTVRRVSIIGGGPSGLMAAEMLSQKGYQVDVFDAMPSVGRKFLLAGVGGMNITHSEDIEPFVRRYGKRSAEIGRLLLSFSPLQLREWIHGLGIETFVGTSGRVFPTEMKAAPLLRAWLHRLKCTGVRFHVRHRWTGWNHEGELVFQTPDGIKTCKPDATLLALGGASWPHLGSDGSWVPLLTAENVDVAPLVPANCGFEASWTPHLREKFAGFPLKTIAISFTDSTGKHWHRQGECMLTEHGLEGSLIYALSAPIRDAIAAKGPQTIHIDLAPGRSADRILADVAHPRGSRSMSSHLQSRVGIAGVKTALVHECLSRDDFMVPAKLAAAIKALPVVLNRPRPIDEVISTAGGVKFEALSDALMLQTRPGVFCAGEMIDWEAPTGGYLLTACFASGKAAAKGMQDWLEKRQ